MKAAIKYYVQSCSICQQAKSDRAPYPGLLLPLTVPPPAWHTISLDFIEGLPKSAHYNCILVVIDKFSKYGHFLPLLHPFLLARSLMFSWTIFTSCMDYRSILCLTEIASSPAHSGKIYSNSLTPSFVCQPHITPSPTDRPRD